MKLVFDFAVFSFTLNGDRWKVVFNPDGKQAVVFQERRKAGRIQIQTQTAFVTDAFERTYRRTPDRESVKKAPSTVRSATLLSGFGRAYKNKRLFTSKTETRMFQFNVAMAANFQQRRELTPRMSTIGRFVTLSFKTSATAVDCAVAEKGRLKGAAFADLKTANGFLILDGFNAELFCALVAARSAGLCAEMILKNRNNGLFYRITRTDKSSVALNWLQLADPTGCVVSDVNEVHAVADLKGNFKPATFKEIHRLFGGPTSVALDGETIAEGCPVAVVHEAPRGEVDPNETVVDPTPEVAEKLDENVAQMVDASLGRDSDAIDRFAKYGHDYDAASRPEELKDENAPTEPSSPLGDMVEELLNSVRFAQDLNDVLNASKGEPTSKVFDTLEKFFENAPKSTSPQIEEAKKAAADRIKLLRNILGEPDLQFKSEEVPNGMNIFETIERTIGDKFSDGQVSVIDMSDDGPKDVTEEFLKFRNGQREQRNRKPYEAQPMTDSERKNPFLNRVRMVCDDGLYFNEDAIVKEPGVYHIEFCNYVLFNALSGQRWKPVAGSFVTNAKTGVVWSVNNVKTCSGGFKFVRVCSDGVVSFDGITVSTEEFERFWRVSTVRDLVTAFGGQSIVEYRIDGREEKVVYRGPECEKVLRIELTDGRIVEAYIPKGVTIAKFEIVD
jgi:hypothetical protein